MKKINLTQLTLLITVMLFTACSNKQEKIKKVSLSQQISVYKIMGITEPKKQIVHYRKKSLNSVKTVVQTTPVEIPQVRYRAVSNWESTPTLDIPSYNEVTTLPLYSESSYNDIVSEPIIPLEEITYNENFDLITSDYNENIIIEDEHIIVSDNDIIESNIIQAEPNISPDIEFISYRGGSSTTSSSPSTIEYVRNRSTSRYKDIVNGIEKNAKSFLGTPYVWGATGPNKFDCSGFTQWVYRDVGIPIPRVSRDQAKVGKYISFNHLKRGDMVFFDTHKRRTGKVTHVGIYLGNGNFIHASSAGKKVVIFNFNKKPFYKKRFLWGRRVTNTNMHYASR